MKRSGCFGFFQRVEVRVVGVAGMVEVKRKWRGGEEEVEK